MKDSDFAFWYVRTFLHARWPEAESYIQKSEGNWRNYKAMFGIE